MTVNVEQVDGITVVTMEGDSLDALTVPAFRRGVAPALEGSKRVVLDLARVMFVDSSGLGAILACLRELNARGGDLRLAGVNPPVQRVFELVRLHKIVEVLSSRAEAIRSWA